MYCCGGILADDQVHVPSFNLPKPHVGGHLLDSFTLLLSFFRRDWEKQYPQLHSYLRKDLHLLEAVQI